ncbi:YcdB/YcdC domain-containing protein [Anoxybacteroides tepidamans]|uniref:YcdB/YcdC domain-containing protein n=1 Tax=Anoxybacteroides tepidamans TaxID=265948 RepID=UPI0004881A60|nr:YcdB/YcdC domain-containing protein [Anoxybacillus tepidamans]
MNKKWLSKLLVTAVLATSAGPITAKAAEEKIYMPPQQKLYQRVGINMQANNVREMEGVNISKEEALEIAKKAVKVDKDYKFQGISFSNDWYGNKPVWQVSWYKEDRGYHDISVTINAKTGKVVNMHIYHEKNDNTSFPPKVSYEQAVDIAKKYIETMYPGKLKEAVMDEQLKKQQGRLPYGNRKFYAVRFYQVVNSVPYYENNIMVTINGNGEIQTFEYNWNDEVTFEKNEKVISEDQVKKLLQDRIQLELRYQLDSSANAKPKLMYVPKSNMYQYYYGNINMTIDAHTGNFIDVYGKPVELSSSGEEKPLSNQATPLPVRNKELTQKEAYEIVQQALPLPKNLVLNSANYEERNETPVWFFTWRSQDDGYSFLNATVNAKTGEIISFDDDSIYRDLESGKNVQINYTKEQALQIASDFARKIAADKADRLYAAPPQEIRYGKAAKPQFYEIYFYRKENGIPVQGQGMTVTVSAETGKIVRFYTEWRNVSFPVPNQVVSLEKAKEIYLNDTKFALSYFTTVAQNESKSNEAILVYQPVPTWTEKYLDAIDGKWKDAATGKVIDDQSVATDIKGHKQEQALQAMIDYNIYDVENGKVYPDKIVTKGEFVEILMRAVGDYGTWYNENAPAPFKDVKKEADYYPYLQRAVDRKWIKMDRDEFQPNSQVTREFVAVTLVRALGYDKLASQNGLFPVTFKDANKIHYKGYVGLISKLKIMPGTKSGEFQPASPLTRADMAVIIYRFMNKYAAIAEN